MSAPIYEGTTPLVSDRYIVAMIAGEDLDIGQVVEVTDVWTVKKTTAESFKVLGVTLTKAANGKKVSVVCRGIVRVTCSGAVAAGDRVKSWSAGQVATLGQTAYVGLGLALTGGTNATIYVALV